MMKKIIFCMILLILSVVSFSQEIATGKSLMTKNDYEQKSKNKKIAAWAFLGGGTAFIVSGVLIGGGKDVSFYNAEAAVVLAGLGILSSIASIPLFIASSRNKRKALNASTYFRFENTATVKQTALALHPYPMIAIKVRF